MMQSYVVCNPLLSSSLLQLQQRMFSHTEDSCVCTGAVTAHFVLVQRCMARNQRKFWSQLRTKVLVNSLLYVCMYKLCDPVIMQVQGQCHVCSLGDNKCLSLRQWNAHVGILPMWSWSCKTPSIGLMFESPCQTIVYGHVSGNGRGHTMWPPPSGNRKLPSCWQGASRREVRQLVLALHQAGGQACSTLIVGILTSWLESL